MDCFAVYAKSSAGDDLLLDEMRDAQVHARVFDGNRYEARTVLDLLEIDAPSLVVTHFWGLSQLTFRGPWQLAFAQLTRLPYIQEWLARRRRAIAQHIFNRRTLESRRRLQLLEELTTSALAGNAVVNAWGLLTARYGDYRWVRHPRQGAHLRELQSQLSMLADIGELERTPSGDYRVTGRAMLALEEAREADRRHRANFALQAALVFLAGGTVFTGLVQANLLKLPTLWDARSADERALEKCNLSSEPAFLLRQLSTSTAAQASNRPRVRL